MGCSPTISGQPIALCKFSLAAAPARGKFASLLTSAIHADLPVDQHQLIALCAPRLCFVSYGVPPGDPNWVDARGSFMAAVLAGPAYRLLGKKDLGTAGNYLTDKMPAVNTFIGGELAWRQHDGGHTNGPNFPAFYEWAGRYISSPGLQKKK